MTSRLENALAEQLQRHAGGEITNDELVQFLVDYDYAQSPSLYGRAEDEPVLERDTWREVTRAYERGELSKQTYYSARHYLFVTAQNGGLSRIPSIDTASDVDGIFHIVADPAERDVDDWRVGRRFADGSFEQLPAKPFIGYVWTSEPSWYADRGNQPYALEVWLPGQARPYIDMDSRE